MPEQVLYLLMMEVVSPWDSRTMWMYWAKIGLRLWHHISQLTMWSTWNQASIYHMAKSITFGKLSWKLSWPTSKQTKRMDSSSDHHRPQQHRSYLWRKRTAAYNCVWTTKLSIEPHWRTDILSRWSQGCLTDFTELGSSRNWTFGMPITSCEWRKATSTKPHFAPRTVSSNTKSCRSVWEMHQLHSKLKWTTVYGLSLMTLLCATSMTYWYTWPMRSSTKNKYEKCSNGYENLACTPKPRSAISESQKSASLGSSLARMGSAWNQTVYQQWRIGQPRSPFGACKCCLDSWTSTGSLTGNMQR